MPDPSSDSGEPALVVTVAATRASRADRRSPVPVRVVHVAGDVDVVTAPTLTAGLAWAQTAPLPAPSGADPSRVEGEPRRVVVDVAAMTFCSVAGMRAFVDAAAAAAARGTAWALAGLPPRLSRLISRLWPDRHLVGYPDRAIAVTAVGLGPPWPSPPTGPPRRDPLRAGRLLRPRPASRGLS